MEQLNRAKIEGGILAFRAARKLGLSRRLEDVAYRVIDIAPAETQTVPRALILDGQFEKLITVEKGTTLDIEKRRTFGGRFERPSIRAYQLKNAVLARGSIYCGRAWKPIVPTTMTPSSQADALIAEYNEAAITGTWLGFEYFGHWLKDDATLCLLAERFGAPISPTPPVKHQSFGQSHIAGYVRFLDLPWTACDAARCKSLTWIDDEDMTLHKGARMRELRDRVRKKVGPARSKKRVFVKRGIPDVGNRRFVNEDEIAARLEKEGFLTFSPVGKSVDEIQSLLHGVELVAGAEGSQMIHAMYHLDEGAGFLCIMPPERFCTVNKRWTDMLGVRYGFAVGDRQEGGGFAVVADDVLRTIALFDRGGAR